MSYLLIIQSKVIDLDYFDQKMLFKVSYKKNNPGKITSRGYNEITD
jgi:hypothetical protein